MKHKEIPVDSIKVPETRVTSYFDSEVYEEFKRTIATMGVIEPIVVVETPEGYFLVDGLHRLIEARANSCAKISAVIIPGEEKDVFLSNLFLNVLRGKQKVQEMRQVIELLFKDYQMGVNQIAEKTGLSERFVDDLLLISKLPPQVVEAFDGGKLEKGKALSLTKLPDAGSQLYMFEALQGKRLTIADWEQYIGVLLAEKGKPVEVAPETAPKPPATHVCDICGEPQELKWLQTVFMCPECLGIAKQSIRIAQQQVGVLEPPAKDA